MELIRLEQKENYKSVGGYLVTGKKADEIRREYWRASQRGICTIWQAYQNPSYYKERAYNQLDTKYRDLADNGTYYMYISGKNSNCFTTVTLLSVNGQLYLIKDTAYNRYIVEVESI